jgi:alpha-galactosidase
VYAQYFVHILCKQFATLFIPAVSFACLGRADNPAPPPAHLSTPPVEIVTATLGKPDAAPFTFKYDGKDAATFLATWKQTEKDAVVAGKHVHQVIYKDPATGLNVTVEVRTLHDFPAVDWVIYFANEGTTDTPIIEDIQPLHATIPCDTPDAILHNAEGSGQSSGDFHLTAVPIQPGQPLTFGTTTGRSSDSLQCTNGGIGAIPFFNIQMGDHGLQGAIGWTGNWVMHINRAADGKTLALDAGMSKTHLLLHPGETIRTPRILLMDGHGDFTAAQNVWRKLMLADYSPRDLQGQTIKVPICWDTWGTERAAIKLAAIKGLNDQKIPADAYWMDAGWYEPITATNGFGWADHRGNWVPSKDLFPDGLRPLGEALRQAGIGYLVWFEAETASPDAPRYKEHPDWYLKNPDHPISDDFPLYLNLGNPDAYKSLASQISQFITDNELTWYRQDFNFSPGPYWAGADTQDRVGMSEIKSIMGLYSYWDELRAKHPGLQIDNCASGGRRLDIETMSRSVALWRSDCAGQSDAEQTHSQGLMPWIPLTAGVWIVTKEDPSAQLYRQRSAYCAGTTVCIGDAPAPWQKTAFDEFHGVQPYFYGDFYPLLDQNLDRTGWCAWQLDRPDLNSGIVLCLRRPGSIYSTLQVDLQAIDPAAKYDVEVRTTMAKGALQTLSGRELANLQVAVPEKPGSTLVFYHKK